MMKKENPLVKKEGQCRQMIQEHKILTLQKLILRTLLAELVRLQAENNKLSKRQISATEEMDF